MSLIDELLGCPLLEITTSYWAAKLNTGEWVSEARYVHDWRQGSSPSQLNVFVRGWIVTLRGSPYERCLWLLN